MFVVKYTTLVLYVFLVNNLIHIEGTSYSNEWLVEADITEEEAGNFSRVHGLRFIKKLHTGHLVFEHLNIPKSSKIKRRHVDVALFKHDYRIRSVEQQKWKSVSLRQYDPSIADPKWSEMWYLRKSDAPSLDVLSTWQLNYTGRGVTIAIVDDGVEVTHQDLADRYDRDNSYDVYDRDQDPSPSNGYSHGTKSAGVALSTKNNVCAVGVAFQARLQAVRLIGPNGITDAGLIEAFGHPATMVSSNSWGGIDGTFDGPVESVQQAFASGVNQLRDKKGIIYVFAAGNGGIDDNCNCDGYVNSIYTIGISSVGRALEPPGYAEPCTAILASAFSGAGGSTDNVCTTDLGNGCTSSFSGTSAAAPMAAGIIALVLQVNPDLTWRDVQEIIVTTSSTSGLLYGSFKTNGAGRQVSDVYGYGLLNAKAMTDAAKSWSTLPCQHTCQSEQRTANLQIQGSNSIRSVSSVITTDGCNDTEMCVHSIEHIQVIITFEYSRRGAVELTLTSPMGASSKLLTPRNQDKDSGRFTWTFMSVHHWGETTVGQWNLTMSLQSHYSSSGTLLSWQLIFYGTGVGCSDDADPRENCTVSDILTGTTDMPNKTIPKGISKETTIAIATCGAFVVVVALVVGISLIVRKRIGKMKRNSVGLDTTTKQIHAQNSVGNESKK